MPQCLESPTAFLVTNHLFSFKRQSVLGLLVLVHCATPPCFCCCFGLVFACLFIHSFIYWFIETEFQSVTQDGLELIRCNRILAPDKLRYPLASASQVLGL